MSCGIGSGSSGKTFCTKMFQQGPDFQLYDDAGVVWSQCEKTAMRSSLPQLQKRYRLKMVYPWGKVQGVNGDYVLAQGRDEFLDSPVSFFSTDAINWAQLPDVDEEAMEKCGKLQDMFFGDPNHEYTIREKVKDPNASPEPASKEVTVNEDGQVVGADAEEDEEAAPEEGAPKKDNFKKFSFKEDKRLAVLVQQVDHVAAVVPRGFLTMDALHHVVPNRMFTGLSQEESLQAASYLHQRPPRERSAQEIVQQEGLTNTRDFLDSIEMDAPAGVWSMQYDPAVRLVILRNLLWPGFVMFVRPETAQWGRCYVGLGVQNVDIAFMLSRFSIPVPGKSLQLAIEKINQEAAKAAEELSRKAEAPAESLEQ